MPTTSALDRAVCHCEYCAPPSPPLTPAEVRAQRREERRAARAIVKTRRHPLFLGGFTFVDNAEHYLVARPICPKCLRRTHHAEMMQRPLTVWRCLPCAEKNV